MSRISWLILMTAFVAAAGCQDAPIPPVPAPPAPAPAAAPPALPEPVTEGLPEPPPIALPSPTGIPSSPPLLIVPPEPESGDAPTGAASDASIPGEKPEETEVIEQ